jgi:nitrogen fixation protein NifX
MERTLSDHAALRVAMAAKLLPEVNVRSLLGLLIQHLGEPLTETKIVSMSPKAFRLMVSSINEESNRGDIAAAFAVMTNREVGSVDAPLVPELPPLSLPKLTVAMTSNQGELVNGHYGSCLRILIYEVNATQSQLIDVREVASTLKGEARSDYLLSLLHDCQMLFTLSIGGPAAARVTRANIHPVKKATATQAKVVLDELKRVINGHPAPWICKLLGIERDVPVVEQEWQDTATLEHAYD